MGSADHEVVTWRNCCNDLVPGCLDEMVPSGGHGQDDLPAPPHRADNDLDGDKGLAAQRTAQRSLDVRVKDKSSIRQAVAPDAPAERSEDECQDE